MKKLLLMLVVMLMAVSAQATITVGTTSVGTYTGGDVGDGLDLDGTFYCAIDAGSAAGGTIRDAVFTSNPNNSVFSGGGTPEDPANGNLVPDFGSSANDEMLETISNSRYKGTSGANSIAFDMASLKTNQEYKVQIGFQLPSNYAYSMCWDVFIYEGSAGGGTTYLLADNVQITNSDTLGMLVTTTFTTDASQDWARIYVGSSPYGEDPIGDARFGSYNLVTVEEIPEPATMALLGLGSMFLLRRKK